MKGCYGTRADKTARPLAHQERSPAESAPRLASSRLPPPTPGTRCVTALIWRASRRSHEELASQCPEVAQG
jgi:hypothetical protein